MIQIKGKNALITGSSRGIGQQIAIGLAKLGCNVIIHGRSSDSCRNTLDLLKAYDVHVYCVSGELSSEKLVNKLINEVKNLNIPIDILYNNAAIGSQHREDFWAHSWEDWIETYKINVVALYSLCAAFIPAMIKNGFGRVVNTSSGIMNQPELAPYGASKWAVNKLTDDLAFKLKDTGVRINTIDPGWIRTDMGGQNADHPVEAVIPGALHPILIDQDGPNGELFSAIDHTMDLDAFATLLIKQ